MEPNRSSSASPTCVVARTVTVRAFLLAQAVFIRLAVVATPAGHPAAAAPPAVPPAVRESDVPRIDVAGTIRFPVVATAEDGDVVIAGLSGICRLDADRWVAVMDTGTAFVTFALDLAADGTPRAIRDLRAVRLAARHDYEDVALCPPAAGRRRAAARDGRLLFCAEDVPALVVIDAAGAVVDDVPIPAVLGRPRPNRGLEALCLAADGAAAWTANEEALPGDGPAPAAGSGTVVRLVEIPLAPAADPRRGRQVAYAVDPPHACVPLAAGDVYSGVVALAALPDGRLLVLERSAARCVPPLENRLYVVDPATAVDVADVAADLAARPAAVVRKALAWRAALGCNLEGLAVGPALAAGGTALVAVADDGGLGQPTQLVVLRMQPAVTSP